jgi:hypothetical protein
MAGKHLGHRRSHTARARRRAAMAWLGTVAGALLAVAFLQTAVAFADPADAFSLVPVDPETVEATYNFLPGVLWISTGTQEFDLDDPSIAGDPTVGTVETDVTNTYILGVTNSEVIVTSDLTGTTGDPAVGSVYDTTIFGDTGYENVFTDVMTVGATTPSVTDTFETPYGDYTVAVVALHLLSFYWHDDAALFATTAATTATTDGFGTSAADGLASTVADLGSAF